MTTAKGAARRAAVLDAAETVLVRDGHTALSLRAVADAAGVRLGHLQYYFPSRDGLVAELLARVLQRSLDQITAAALGGADGAGAPEAPAAPDDPAGPRALDGPQGDDGLISALLAQQTDARLVRVFVELWALAARDEAVAVVVRDFYRQYADLLADRVRTHAPGLPPEERRARAEVFIALIEGSSLLRSGVAGAPSAAADALIARTALGLLTGS